MTLPSWRDGEARRRILAFLGDAARVPEDQRVAVLDNDGTLWCERPNYAQVDFMVSLLRSAAREDPGLRDRPEYAAVLSDDRAELARLGLPRVALALAELCSGLEPEAFSAQVEEFMAKARHPTLAVTYAQTVYHPMLELVDALRGSGFRVFVVTGGGIEFVRAISRRLYDVPPECVIGTHVRYDLGRAAGRPMLLRTASLDGDPNEGAVKIDNIQRHIGQRPIFAAGNSAGDLEMLDYTASGGGLSLAVVVDHDDDEREFAYAGEGVTVSIDRPFIDVARENDWIVVSMRRDWSTVFPSR